MSAQDYNFDPTALSPDNLITNEVHPLSGTVAVIPNHGAFYREGLQVEGVRTVNGETLIEPLRADIDFLFSPLYIRPSAVAGKEAYSYVLIREPYDQIRLTYQCVGGEYGEDTRLLTKVSQASFDRMSIAEWLTITGSESYHPEDRLPILSKETEIEILNSGMQRIYETLSHLAGNGDDKATNQQVTNLEVRQTVLENRQDDVTLDFNDIRRNFDDIRDLFFHLEDTFLRGCCSNLALDGGYVYQSETPANTHVITHGLNTLDIDVTVWVWDQDTNKYRHTLLIQNTIVDVNTIRIVSDIEPVDLLVVVRPVTVDSGGYIYTSPAPDVNHYIEHNLNTGFISGNVWVLNSAGEWEWAVVPLKIVSNTRVEVIVDVPSKVRVILQKPLPNAYLYKSRSGQFTHRIKHCLNSPHVGVSIWAQNPDGSFSTCLPSTALSGPNTIEVDLDQSKIIKVVVQPSQILEPSFQQANQQEHLIMRDRLDQLQSAYYSLETLLQSILNGSGNLGGGNSSGGGTGNTSGVITYRYESDVPAIEHQIVHNLDEPIPDVVVWVQGSSGDWYKDSVETVMEDNNVIKIILSLAANVRVRVSKA